MSRPQRSFPTPNTVYHVISRGNNRQEIFLDNRDYFRYLDLWRKHQAEMDFTVYAYVLMPNHVHWLLKTGFTTLPEIMHRTHSTYARWFNHRHERVGHLFQDRYKSIICDTDSYLLALARYIHLNPIRAGMAREVHHYPWSSYPGYCGHENPLLDTSLLLGYYGQIIEKARAKFISFTMEGIKEIERQDKSASITPPALQKEKRHQMPFDSNHENQGSRTITPKSKQINIEQIADWIIEETGAALAEIQSNNQQYHVLLARYLLIRIAVGEAGVKRSMAARFLHKSRAHITTVMEKWQQNDVPHQAEKLLAKFVNDF